MPHLFLESGNAFIASVDDPVTQSILDFLAKQEQERRADYALFRAYYGGDHPTRLTDRMKRFVNQDLKFADNFSEVVVDALAERLTVSTFQSETDSIAEWAWGAWTANRMDQVQAEVHTDAIMLGDTYVLVDFDNEQQRSRFTHQLAETIIPHYNETTGKIDVASKKWLDVPELGGEPRTRMNLYFPERVEKYVVSGARWVQFQEPGDRVWPLPWLRKDGAPLGISILHFVNKPAGGRFGRSELATVIPLQDILNKHIIDLVLVNDGTGFRLPFTVNIDHSATTYTMLPGTIMKFNSLEEGQFEVGEFAPGDPEGILKSIELIVQHIAGISRTPQHLFQIADGAVSGEALKTAESGLVSKAKKRQVNFGNTWEDVMLMGLRVQEAFGAPVAGSGPNTHISAIWEDSETRNQESFLKSLESKMRLGIPERQLWREMGYNQEEIDQMEKDKEEESARVENLGGELLRQFTGGAE